MTTVSLRIDSNLARQAEREARVENRSKAKQLEYWAKLGRVISSKLNLADAIAVAQGLKEIKLEVTQPAQSIGIDVIITDHHEPGESLPIASAIINPKQPDCDYISEL